MVYCPHCMHPSEGSFCPQCGGPLEWKPAPGQLSAGAMLNGGGLHRYVTGKALGQGGFGITYIAVDPDTRQRVAVKECFPAKCVRRAPDGVTVEAMPGMESIFGRVLESFLAEGRTLVRQTGLGSIVKVLDFFRANGTAYLVMEYLDGVPMHRRISQSGRIPAAAALAMFRPLIRDLAQLHASGIIHRDISPDNIMLMPDRTLRLIDFGSARDSAQAGGLSVVFKSGFAPVEQYRAEGQGAWTDIYSLCASIYYCITGSVPPSSVERLESDTLLPPSRLGVNIAPAQEQALMWGLAVQPKDRPRSVSLLASALYPAAQGGAQRQTYEPSTYQQQTYEQRQTYTQQPGGEAPGPREGEAGTPARPGKGKKRGLIFGLAGGAAVLVAAAALLLTGVLGGRRGTTPDGFNYVIRGGEATLTGAELLSGDVILPSEIDGSPVTAVAADAFAGQDGVTSITVPVRMEVEDGAFECDSLRALALHSGMSSERGWGFPPDTAVYSLGEETGAGALEGVEVAGGVVYALTDEDCAVVMDIPGGVSEVTLEDSVGGVSVVYLNERALDNASASVTVYLAADMIYPFELYGAANWDHKDSSSPNCLSFSWDLSCVCADIINSQRGTGEPKIAPVREYVLAAMSRAQDLSVEYGHTRPDGSEWSEAIFEQGLSPSYYTEWIDYSYYDDSDSLSEMIYDSIVDIVPASSDYGIYYTEVGIATYMDLSSGDIYFCRFGGANE